MFDLNKALSEWKRSLRKYESFEEGAITELESHLLDEFDKQKRNGLADEEAFARATAAVGRPEDVGGEYFKDSRRSRLTTPSWQKSRFSFTLPLNYLKMAWRRIFRHKGYSFVSIAGMTVGLTCVILILTYVNFEFGFDRFHKKADRIYRVISRPTTGMWKSDEFMSHSPAILAAAMSAEIPGVARTARLMEPEGEKAVLRSEGKNFLERGLYADGNFLEIFSFPLLRGDRHSSLARPGSIVLSAGTARKLFGDANPLGRPLGYHEQTMRFDLTVSGVLADVPRNSHLQFDYLVSIATLESNQETADLFNEWDRIGFTIFAELLPHGRKAEIEKKITGLLVKNSEFCRKFPPAVVLQPLRDINLRSRIQGAQATNMQINTVYLFVSIALLILWVACLNFVNLSTARSATRAREIGLRKAIGASRGDLVRQFVGESMLISFLSLSLAFALALLLIERFGMLIGTGLTIGDLFHGRLVLAILAAALFSGFSAGIYPGIVLSGFKPVRALQKFSEFAGNGPHLRRILVVLQFSVAITLMVGAMVVWKQLRFIESRKLGYDREHVVVIPLRDQETREKSDIIKAELARLHEVAAVSVPGDLPTGTMASAGTHIETESGEMAETRFRYANIDPDFMKLFAIPVVQGRNFSPGFQDEEDGMLVNETLVRKTGWKNPLGKKIMFFRDKPYRVIGVVKDFNFDSLHSGIEPAVFMCGFRQYLSVRIRPGNTGHTLNVLKAALAKSAPSQPFDFFFLDDAFNELYGKERKLGEIFSFFAGLAIFIACLGLFSLAAFIAERKTKEIGVRKALGASSASIVLMLNKSFLRWIIAANIISWPLAYLAMNRWLQDFNYRISLGWGTFLLAGIFTLALAMLTVSYQTLRVALANPVDSLRYE